MEDQFKTVTGFKSYVAKPEITNLGPQFLVKGSKNVLIDFANRIISRNGYILYGAAATTNSSGCRASYEWDTSTAKQFPLKVNDNTLRFYWNSTWNTLKSNLSSSYLEFAKIWNNTEKIDILLWVLGETNTYSWSGGVAKIASSTATTVTKQGVLTAKTTIAFVAGTPGTVAPTITDSAAQFLVAGFATGDSLYVTGSTLNNRIFTIGSVTASTITLIMTDVLTSEIAGPAITLHNGEPTWASARFLTTGGVVTKGTVTMTIATPCVVSFTAHGLVAGDQVQFTTTGALPTGILASTTYYVIAAGLGADTFEISLTAGGSAINTSGSQSGVHTLYKTTNVTKKVTYNGIDYPYTGGEATDTLIGLTLFPATVQGDPIWQTPVTLANPVAIPASFKQDLIGVQLNQLILASTKSQEIYISSTTDYTNFTLTSPRAPGDPAKVTMDNYCTCIIPIDNQAQTTSALMFGGGTNEFFQFAYQLAQDNLSELVRMVKLKTASGSGVISKGAIGSIKNSVAYISREPMLDLLSHIEGADTAPLSDLIKTDFDSYDFTGTHIRYWKRAIYIAIPREGLVLIYDLQRKLWHPPQTIAVSRLAIIGDWLYGHSSVNDESYKLFVGTNDNGNFIPQVINFAYNNGGKRDRLKNLGELWADGYITANATLTRTVYYDFAGASGKKMMTIDGSDSTVVNPVGGSPLGDEPLGSTPIGGDNLNDIAGLPGTNATLLRFWQIDTNSLIDYIEIYEQYTMNTLDGQFALVGYGTDMWDSGTSPITHKK